MKKKVVALKILFFLSLFLITAFFVFSLNYETFTFQLLKFYNKTDKLVFFRQNLLTRNRLLVLQTFFLGSYAALSALILWKGKFLIKWLISSKNFTQNQFKSFSKKIKSVWIEIYLIEKIILFIPLIIYISFWWIYGWQNDEIFSYTFLIDRGVLVCAMYYPGPNNHVAFLVFAAFLHKILPPFVTDFICMKLPSTFAAIFSLWMVWLFFYRKNQYFLAWLSYILITFHWGFFFYAAHGRGYAWVVFLFIMSCYAIFKIINNQNSITKYWLLWAFCMLLGCYTIPTFIYIWLGSLLGLWIVGTNKIRKESFFTSLTTGIVILLLYSPILVFNGLSAVVSNSWVIALSFEKWLTSFPAYFWNVHGITGIFALLSSLFLFFHKKNGFKLVVIYFWCIAYLPHVIIFMQRVLPFERVFLYRQVAEILMICVGINAILEKFNFISYHKTLTAILIFLAIFYGSFRVYSEYYRYKIGLNIYQFAEPLAKKVYHKNPTSVLVLEDTYNVFLRYYFRNSNTKVEVSPNQSIDYDIIIIPQEKSPSFLKSDSLKYFIFYEDDFVKGFERK